MKKTPPKPKQAETPTPSPKTEKIEVEAAETEVDSDDSKKKARRPRPNYGRYSDPKNFIQIGCTYYYLFYSTDAAGISYISLKPWLLSQLRHDMTAAQINSIRRYDDLACYPCNIYSKCPEAIGPYQNIFNMYSPSLWQPNPGQWPTIEKLLRHIFGEQYENGLDYLQLLYANPMQQLPILLLVSEERQTGKTTFLNFLKWMFNQNAIFVSSTILCSPFNGERANKLLVLCDEAILNKKEQTEHLKAISTATKNILEFKGKDRFEIDNFVKIVLCSNEILAPVYIDRDEIRFWVCEVGHLEEFDPFFNEKLKAEIPAFLAFLLSRQMHVTEPQSRMWFAPQDLRTPALERIMRACRPSDEIELAEAILNQMDIHDVDTIEYTATDLEKMLKNQDLTIRNAHHIVCKQWRVPRAPNKQAYDRYMPFCPGQSTREYGRYYTFTRDFLQDKLT